MLDAAGLADRFDTVVSGAVAKERGLPGKPAPDTFVYAAEVLGATPATSVVLEDAVSGVRPERPATSRSSSASTAAPGRDTLTDAGADLVVSDLQELVP